MSSVLRPLLAAVLLTALPVAAGVTVAGQDPEEPSPPAGPPPYASTPLAAYDTTTVAIARAGFCDRIVEEAVAEALDGEARDATSYANGEETELVAEGDIAHEYGCTYVGARGAEARAWVFAPPVTADRAAALVDAAVATPGCSEQRGAAAYGAPSVALVCSYRERRFASYRGLFGDAWLACSLALPARIPVEELLDRAGRWCVAAAEAAAA